MNVLIEGTSLSVPQSIHGLLQYVNNRMTFAHGTLQLEKAICSAVVKTMCTRNGVNEETKSNILHYLNGTQPGAKPGTVKSAIPRNGGKSIHERMTRLLNMDAEAGNIYHNVLTGLDYSLTEERLVEYVNFNKSLHVNSSNFTLAQTGYSKS